jgi:hypothetical protein
MDHSKVLEQYLDQAALNCSKSQIATSYYTADAGSMSGTGGNQSNCGDDDGQSEASFYTSYTVGGERLGRKEIESGRVASVAFCSTGA